MDDRQLLEMAARAAGYNVVQHAPDGSVWCVPRDDGEAYGFWWAPLADDGDALRLAVKLHINIEFLRDAVRCSAPGKQWVGETCLPCDSDHLGTAHRRAIVRAAAALGERDGTS